MIGYPTGLASIPRAVWLMINAAGWVADRIRGIVELFSG